jgi:hypothetical protein
MFFSAFFAAAIGYVSMDDQEIEQVQIPWKKLLNIAIL